MKISLNVSLFSYLDRPIYDVDMNGTDFMAAMEYSFYGSNAVMMMQSITLGPQLVTWRMGGPEGAAGNGEIVRARNIPTLDEISKDIKWLALHIYDDNTVEIKLSKGSKDELQTIRGRQIIEEWERKHGK
ncbi:hypothetical protein [Massilia haematophila]|uniref:Uncharacterized protein n=1 Tax=Massilia haematophila TaxID=457923 RepID=A0ABV7PP30_9BURK